MKQSTRITRQQIIFLSYLVENGYTGPFRIRQVMTAGLSWDLARQYLRSLQKIGYAEKKGCMWAITKEGRGFYSDFMREFTRWNEGAIKWR